MRKIFLFLGLLAIPKASWPQSAARAEILVIGTYHMANPGSDVHNMRVDDVLSPKRQQEIAQLIDVLKTFCPTKIAIEAAPGGRRVQQYADYLAGTYTLSRNEIDQLGYRLAKELGHRSVHPVDVDGDYPYYRVLNYAKANGRVHEFDAMSASVAAMVKAQSDFLQSHSVLETLLYMNSDSHTARHVAVEYAYLPFGDPFDYAGPDLIAAWFQRNVRIHRNINALIESPNDRILVIYGSGHLGWLRQSIANHGSAKLRKLAELAAAK